MSLASWARVAGWVYGLPVMWYGVAYHGICAFMSWALVNRKFGPFPAQS